MPMTEQIASALGFTLDELSLNRVGELSSGQAWHATRQALTFAGLTIFMLVLVIALIALRLPNILVRVLAVGASCAGLVGMSVFTWHVVHAAIARQVETNQGALSIPGGGRGLTVMINGQRVGVPVAAAGVLQVGDTYRVYTLAHSHAFLSMEPVSSAEAAK